jgi:hypothetical protein
MSIEIAAIEWAHSMWLGKGSSSDAAPTPLHEDFKVRLNGRQPIGCQD